MGEKSSLEAAMGTYMLMTLKQKNSLFEFQLTCLMSTLYVLLMRVAISFILGVMTTSVSHRRYKKYEWDYRWMDYPPQARDCKHPYDQSVATYKGHSVLRTLIHCYFSPEYSTGQKYIYTGSHDSCIYVYDLVSGDQVAKLQHHRSTVRDCSWHPVYPMLVSSSWDGDVMKWEFPGNGEATVPAND